MRSFPLEVSAALALVLLATGTATARPPGYALSLAAGMHIPHDDDHNRVYGASTLGSIELSGRLSRSSNIWIDAGIGVRYGEGKEIGGRSTFELDDASYVIVPLCLGLRGNLAATEGEELPVRVHGAGGIVVASVKPSLPDPITHGDLSERWALGVYAELRPELRLSHRWGAFVRARVEVMDAVSFERMNALNPSGSRFELGVTRWL